MMNVMTVVAVMVQVLKAGNDSGTSDGIDGSGGSVSESSILGQHLLPLLAKATRLSGDANTRAVLLLIPSVANGGSRAETGSKRAGGRSGGRERDHNRGGAVRRRNNRQESGAKRDGGV